MDEPLVVENALAQAVAHHQAGRLSDAERLYRVILNAQPQHIDANHNIGVLALQLGKPEVALPYFRSALEADPTQRHLWIRYIDTLLQAGHNAPAREALAQGKQGGLGGPDVDALAVRAGAAAQEDELFAAAVAYRKARQLSDARDCYLRLLSLNPRHFAALGNLGDIFQDLGRPEEAVEIYRRFQEIKPDSAEAHLKIGIALSHLFQREEAMESFRCALKIAPEFAEAHFNLGSQHAALGQNGAAEMCYRRALKIKPDYVEAHLTLSNVLREFDRMEEASESLRRALVVYPDYVEAHLNLGFVFQCLGKMEAAEASYYRALEFDPGNVGAWNNLRNIAVVAKYCNGQDDLSEVFIRSKLDFRAFSTREFAAYEYYIQRFSAENSDSYYKSAISDFMRNDNEYVKIEDGVRAHLDSSKLPENIVALFHFGRSGSGLLHSLIDGHSSITTFPSYYLSEFFNASVWEMISAEGWRRIPEKFAALYDVIFDAKSPKPVPGIFGMEISFVGQNEGMTRVGNKRNESLFVNREKFCSEAIRLMKLYDKVDRYCFFKIIHAAYEFAIGTTTEKQTIFYHIHNPSDYAMLNFLSNAPTSRLLMMVRDPIKSCESWCKSAFIENDYDKVSTKIIVMLLSISHDMFSSHDSLGVRLEDLKHHPNKTIPALCDWLGVKVTPSLFKMTAQGKKWWGDPSSPSYNEKTAMSPFGEESLFIKHEPIFSEADQFVFQTLFYPFSVRFGYTESDPTWFKKSLKIVRIQLEEMMDFEKVLSKRLKIDPAQFKLSFDYLFFRAGLFSRLDILDKLGDYPNMPRPLDLSGKKYSMGFQNLSKQERSGTLKSGLKS